MSRKPITTVSNEPEEFICEWQKKLDKNAKDIKDCPIVFIGKRLNRDQRYMVRDLMQLKDFKNPDKGIIGMGAGYKYMWENIITKVKNVYKPGDSIEGDKKDALWDAENMETEQNEAITHFYVKSNPTEEESKTSD